jgi:sec-independent protein translocase protein TatC
MDAQIPALTDPDEFEDAEVEEETGRRMSFLEHLEELRRRLVYSLYGLVGGSIISFIFVDRLFKYMLHYMKALGGHLIFTELTGAFMLEFKIGLLGGLLIASPFIFAQLWFFVAPGLYTREKRIVMPFVLSSTILFLSGVLFAHLIAFPNMWRFFGSFAGPDLEFFPTIGEAFSFYIKMVLGLGLVFELPMLVFFLARFGIVTWRFLWQKSKIAIVLIFIIAALVTPSPDPINQCIFAAPMLVLYGLSIGVAAVFGKKRPAEE